MPTAIIKTSFGSIEISYENAEELSAALSNLNLDIHKIESATGDIKLPTPRSAKPGYESSYRFLANGKVELLFFPTVSLHVVILALSAYHPNTISIEELERVTGIASVVSKVVGQTKNNKYFRKEGNEYGLTPEGFALLQDKIKPLLPSSIQENQEE